MGLYLLIARPAVSQQAFVAAHDAAGLEWVYHQFPWRVYSLPGRDLFVAGPPPAYVFTAAPRVAAELGRAGHPCWMLFWDDAGDYRELRAYAGGEHRELFRSRDAGERETLAGRVEVELGVTVDELAAAVADPEKAERWRLYRLGKTMYLDLTPYQVAREGQGEG